MHFAKKYLKKYTLPILSGIMIGTTYIPFYPWALAFCLVPLWLFWTRNKEDMKTLFVGGWITQFILNIIGFHWVANTAIEFGGFPAPLGYVVLLLFASIAHLYYPIAGVLWAYLSPRVSPRWSLALIPLIFAICESFYPTIFFWHLGYPWLWVGLPATQMTEWIGFYGLNLITLVLNLLILLFVLQRNVKHLVFAILLFTIPNLLGLWLKKTYQEGEQKLQVLLVQANIGNAIKVEQDKGSRFHDFIVSKFLNMTAQVTETKAGTQLIIWPETAYPGRISAKGRKDYYQEKLQYSVDTIDIPLLTGAYEQNENGEVYNSMVLFNKKGEFVKSYKKTMLLAFGEYFPGSKFLPQLKKWFPMVSDFGRGTGPDTLLAVDGLPLIGAQICYESLFDENSKILFDKGAQVIVNVTNDSWFGYSFEPYQHLYMTLARALEFRIPVIRATNTGISTIMTAGGKIGEFSPRHAEWAGTFEVPYHAKPKHTLYSYYAGLWPLILLFVLLFILWKGRRNVSRKS